ncbi:MAG: site-2 protease family protein [Gemmatimonadota bacterium]
MTGQFRLGSVLGFEIRIDFSWFVIFFLILWTFSAGAFPSQVPGRSSATYVAMGTIGTLLFFASLVAHELAHSVVARRRGIPVEGITLFIFGGMARTRLEAEEPGDEFAIAIVGPLSSLLIAAAFWAVGLLGGELGWGPEITVVARYLAFLNVALAVFNMLPGFPLDGGRVFRAAVWRATGDVRKATRWASTGGAWLGYGLMGLGVLQLFAGAVLGGLWFLFIGWFLRSVALTGYRQHVLRRLLDDVPARDVMRRDPDALPPGITLQEAVDEHFMRRRHHAFPIVDEDGRPVGLLTMNQVKAIPRARWTDLHVRDVMTPAAEISVGPDESVVRVMELLGEVDARRALVVRGDRLVGLVTAADLTAWIRREEELEELRGSSPPA